MVYNIVISSNDYYLEVLMRYSKQREEILKIVSEAEDHPTAMMVYDRVKKIMPHVSLGTVYRNLNVLATEGVISKILMKDGYDRFDKTTNNHNHLYCEKCGKIIDIDSCFTNEELRKIEDKTGFKITNCNFKINGICAKCAKERKE